MHDYFGYEDDLKRVERDPNSSGGVLETGFDDEAWESMLYDELKAGRPVMYAGRKYIFYGHAFVLDGYRDGYFHVNWGWSGGLNGYYLLTTLGGWNELQEAIINIKPARTGDKKMYSLADYTNKKLTFYYDDKMKERAATVDGNTTGKVKRLPVKTNDAYYKDGACDEICFDASMADYHFITTAKMFQNCKVKRISGLEYLNTSCVSSMDAMFDRCNVEEPLDLSHFDTRRVISVCGMFSSSGIASLDLSSFNTANVTNMGGMFSGCAALTNLDLSNLNTANVTNMSGMFSWCTALTSLNLSDLNTANVTTMTGMFGRCKALTSLDLSSFNTEKVTGMIGMFIGCSKLKTIFVSDSKWSDKGYLDEESLPDDWYMMELSYRRSGMDDKQIEEMKESMISNPGKEVFLDCYALVGGAGTKYNAAQTSSRYACIDGGANTPGYLTDIKAKPSGISTVSTDTNAAPIYTLSGMKLQPSAPGTKPGIYIQSGKKIVRR